jgi:hypothetical protein
MSISFHCITTSAQATPSIHQSPSGAYFHYVQANTIAAAPLAQVAAYDEASVQRLLQGKSYRRNGQMDKGWQIHDHVAEGSHLCCPKLEGISGMRLFYRFPTPFPGHKL